MNFSKTLAAIVIISSSFISQSDTFAGVAIFTTRASWESALGVTSDSLQGSGFESDTEMILAGGTTALADIDVTISSNPTDLTAIVCCETNPDGAFQGQRFDGYLTDNPDAGPEKITFGLRGTMDAFGADFDQVNNAGMGMIVNDVLIDFRDHFGSADLDEDSGFLGVIDTDGFQSVDFVMTNENPLQAEYWQVDNLSMNAVPEPSSLGLFAGCLVVLAVRRRRV